MTKKYIIIVPALVIGISTSLLVHKLFSFDTTVTETSHMESAVSKDTVLNTNFDQSKSSSPSAQTDIVKAEQSVKIKKKVYLADALSNTSQFKLDKILKSDAINKKKYFKLINKELAKSLKCITNGSCIKKDPSKPFFDLKNHPEVYKVENMLSALNELSLDNPKFLNSLSDNQLISAMKLNNTRIFVMASALLLNKGESHFNKAIKHAKSFDGQVAASLVELSFKTQKGAQRSELVKHYLNSKNQGTLSSVVDSLNRIDLTSSEAELFVGDACANIINPESESSRMIRYNIQKIARKFNIKNKCKL